MVIQRLNPLLRGWYGYFRHSHWSALREADGFVRRRLRSILRGFAKKRGSARPEDNFRYPNALFSSYGLISLEQRHAEEAGRRDQIAFPARA